jgi:XTP/dITP diphosphohydrolase
MARSLTASRLVIASHNPGKVREVAALFGPLVPALSTAAEHGLADPEETGATFIANAELKARSVAAATGECAIADDSGLVVPALGGAPGIHSARWAEGQGGGPRDFRRAMGRVHEALGEAMAGTPAHFVSVLALCWPDGHCETAEGTVEGHLAWPPRGDRGFGYDPIFVPAGHGLTFGEMEPAAKDAISHRTRAFAVLRARCLAGA